MWFEKIAKWYDSVKCHCGKRTAVSDGRACYICPEYLLTGITP